MATENAQLDSRSGRNFWLQLVILTSTGLVIGSAVCLGVGVRDYDALDVALAHDGKLMVVDGFDEFGPDGWRNISYGLADWLMKLVKNKVEPFWLGTTK